MEQGLKTLVSLHKQGSSQDVEHVTKHTKQVTCKHAVSRSLAWAAFQQQTLIASRAAVTAPSWGWSCAACCRLMIQWRRASSRKSTASCLYCLSTSTHFCMALAAPSLHAQFTLACTKTMSSLDNAHYKALSHQIPTFSNQCFLMSIDLRALEFDATFEGQIGAGSTLLLRNEHHDNDLLVVIPCMKNMTIACEHSTRLLQRREKPAAKCNHQVHTSIHVQAIHVFINAHQWWTHRM